MLTRILVITIAVALACVAFGRTQEPCGRDGCPVQVKLVSAPAPTSYASMPVSPYGPTVVRIAPVQTFAMNHPRLMHPMQSFAAHHPRMAHPMHSFAMHHPKLAHPMAMVRCRCR